eukprot:Skav228738  [mRNA]  locus=scaffold655:205894:207169:- [translate_table: standard]
MVRYLACPNTEDLLIAQAKRAFRVAKPQGYEPKLAAMERRSKSIPPNPFWSSTAKEEWRLVAARPDDLPRVPSDDEENMSHAEEAPRRNPRHRSRSRPELRGPREEGKEGATFETPVGGKEETKTREKRWRRMKKDEDEDETAQGLQRGLEKAMVDHLHQENEKLKQEIEILRSRQASSGSAAGGSMDVSRSNQSWSEVEAEVKTPRRRKLQDERCTPGGTRVPLGTPPKDEDEPMPLPPPLPPYPRTEEVRYERVDVYGKARREEREWRPRREEERRLIERDGSVWTVGSRSHRDTGRSGRVQEEDEERRSVELFEEFERWQRERAIARGEQPQRSEDVEPTSIWWTPPAGGGEDIFIEKDGRLMTSQEYREETAQEFYGRREAQKKAKETPKEGLG